MKTLRLIFAILFLFVSFTSFGQVRTTVLSIVPATNIASSDDLGHYSATGGLGFRSTVTPTREDANFYWGPDLVIGFSYFSYIDDDLLEKYPQARGIFHASLQIPLGYSWKDPIEKELNFFIGGGPTVRVKFPGSLLQFGTFLEAGFFTKKSDEIGFFLSTRLSFYSIIFSPIPVGSTGLSDHELAVLVGMKWDTWDKGSEK